MIKALIFAGGSGQRMNSEDGVRAAENTKKETAPQCSGDDRVL